MVPSTFEAARPHDILVSTAIRSGPYRGRRPDTDPGSSRFADCCAARWERACTMGAVYRALSPPGSTPAHRVDLVGADIGIGWAKPTLFLLASLSRLCFRPHHRQRHRGCRPRMVSGAERRLFRSAGDSAHVGRNIAVLFLLDMLDGTRATRYRSVATALSSGTCNDNRRYDLDRLSRGPTRAGRRSPHGGHAWRNAQVARCIRPFKDDGREFG